MTFRPVHKFVGIYKLKHLKRSNALKFHPALSTYPGEIIAVERRWDDVNECKEDDVARNSTCLNFQKFHTRKSLRKSLCICAGADDHQNPAFDNYAIVEENCYEHHPYEGLNDE